VDVAQKFDGLEEEVRENFGDKIVGLRRNIHREPEIGFDTERTASKVVDALAELPLEVRAGVAQNGLVALLRGAKPGPTVALRADMDALLIQEETGLPFASEIDGKMHACGHDGHTSMLVGAAHLLSELQKELEGNVKFVFQPAEEGGRGGGRVMIEEGILEDVSSAFALHLWPLLPHGTVAVKAGAMMAASDRFVLKVRGRGGHAAMPHLTVDAAVISAHVVVALQTLVAREVNPVKPAVLTLGKIEAGNAFNVIPEEAEIAGTVRTLDPKLRQTLPGRIEDLAHGLVRGMRGDAELDYEFCYPVTRNDPKMAGLALDTVRNLFGDEAAIEVDHPSMGAEDFAFFLEKLPGAYVWLGCRDEEHTSSVHTPTFGFSEDILPKGSALLAALALKALG
jgi:hippurate hydrolase